MSYRVPALDDAQKGDLSVLWDRHAPLDTASISGTTRGHGRDVNRGNDAHCDGGDRFRGRGGLNSSKGRHGKGVNFSSSGGNSGGGVAATTASAMILEDNDYTMICRLYAFLHWAISGIERSDKRSYIRDSTPDEDPSSTSRHSHEELKTNEALSFLFQKVKVRQENASENNVNLSEIVVPRIRGGNQVISWDYASFIEEFRTYEESFSVYNSKHQLSAQTESTSSSSLGFYLHHHPDRCLTSLACTVGLTVLTLWRRYQLLSPIQSLLVRGPYINHPHLVALGTAVYQPRFYHLTSSFLLRMADIRTSTVGKLISVRGTVTKARPKRLRVLDSGFVCAKCGLQQICKFMDGKYSTPTRCEGLKCRSQRFVLNRKVANFCDVQELKVQESREELYEEWDCNGARGENEVKDNGESKDVGRAPRHIEVEVADDMVDRCNAGDSIDVVGIVRAVNSALASGRGGKRALETSTYKLYVMGHSIINLTAEGRSHCQDEEPTGLNRDLGEERRRKRICYGLTSSSSFTPSSLSLHYTQQQLQQIASIAHADHLMYSLATRMAFPFDLVVRSFCPAIIGNDLVKAGIILCLLGGTPPEASGLEARSGMTIRSNLHMLIVGDPGMGKSQMLLSANQVASRSVYVGGNTASSTGLTVSLTKEAGGDLGIEAGALVLADRGVCCLDELDKMAKGHQDGLLEAMEQQQVSIAKAGVVASLPSRCSVIAAANPKSGHYNMGKSVAENISMASPLLSRFDLVFILRDRADKERDRIISGSIVGQFRKINSHSEVNNGDRKHADFMDQFEASGRAPIRCRLPWVAEFQKKPLPLQQLKDYIAYAREYCRPKMTDAAANVLHEYFMKLRHPGINEEKKDNVPITTRQLEALIRLSQARAKACLRAYVLREDAEDVIELMIESVKQVHMDEGGQIDKARGGAGGKSKQRRAFLEAMRMSGQQEFAFLDLQRIADRLSLPVTGFRDFLEDLREAGEIMKSNDGISATFSLGIS